MRIAVLAALNRASCYQLPRETCEEGTGDYRLALDQLAQTVAVNNNECEISIGTKSGLACMLVKLSKHIFQPEHVARYKIINRQGIGLNGHSRQFRGAGNDTIQFAAIILGHGENGFTGTELALFGLFREFQQYLLRQVAEIVRAGQDTCHPVQRFMIVNLAGDRCCHGCAPLFAGGKAHVRLTFTPHS